ncbi:MAG: DUF1735 domain-containing protein [Bacteroidota bacterium]|nr:DUF1735 domain-containing protein [Bacteroidota bacterium]
MKKIIALIVLITAMSACYEDYILDYEYDGIYLPYQLDVRTFVVGEGMRIKVGAALGGVRDNNRDRAVNFQIDNSLINPATLESMKGAANYIKNSVDAVTELKTLPANYYSLSDNSKIVIKKGDHSGTITLTPDSARFLTDMATLNATYALPIRITSADADTVLKSKDYAVIGLKYENMLFGNYWHGGSAVVKRPGKTDTIFTYYTTIPMVESKVWKLYTRSPKTLAANGFLDQTTAKDEMILMLDGVNISIGIATGSTYAVSQNGDCTFNRAKLLQKRKIFLKYKYLNTANGFTYHATDTLTFRNRIRDGINEWQDENPNNYK